MSNVPLLQDMSHAFSRTEAGRVHLIIDFQTRVGLHCEARKFWEWQAVAMSCFNGRILTGENLSLKEYLNIVNHTKKGSLMIKEKTRL